MNLEQEIQEFNKAQREHIEKSIDTPIENILIEKGGKPAQIGEIREFAGKKYQKGSNGWKPVKKEDSKKDDGKEKEEKVKHPYGNNTKTEYNDVVRVVNALGKTKPMFIDPVRNKTFFRLRINQENKDEILKKAQSVVPSVELVEGSGVNRGEFFLYVPKNDKDKEVLNYSKY
jgi:hypothetical protein